MPPILQEVVSEAVAHFAEAIVPIVLVIMVAIGGWMLKQIVSLGNWRASHEGQAKERNKVRDYAGENAHMALQGIEQHGEEMNELRSKIEAIANQLAGYFGGLDRRLERIETRCAKHLEAIARQNDTDPNRGKDME